MTCCSSWDRNCSTSCLPLFFQVWTPCPSYFPCVVVDTFHPFQNTKVIVGQTTSANVRAAGLVIAFWNSSSTGSPRYFWVFSCISSCGKTKLQGATQSAYCVYFGPDSQKDYKPAALISAISDCYISIFLTFLPFPFTLMRVSSDISPLCLT